LRQRGKHIRVLGSQYGRLLKVFLGPRKVTMLQRN
jgi:hypothetical protein